MAELAIKKKSNVQAKPILKWAGGKTQMLGELMPKVPASYGRYIEPFIGGGAMFFALNPRDAIIADSNPELINMYRQVADSVDEVISCLQKYENTSEMFYEVREQDWMEMSPVEAAARTIYLNKACLKAIHQYLEIRPKDGIKTDKNNSKNALFLSERKERISRRTVQHIVEKQLAACGFSSKKLSTHKLRHTAATLMYQYGQVDIRALQEILGHESISTTEIYTHVANEQAREAIERNPLANI